MHERQELSGFWLMTDKTVSLHVSRVTTLLLGKCLCLPENHIWFLSLLRSPIIFWIGSRPALCECISPSTEKDRSLVYCILGTVIVFPIVSSLINHISTLCGQEISILSYSLKIYYQLKTFATAYLLFYEE